MVFSQRETEVANLLLEGATNRDIAEKLGMPNRTVKCYMNCLFERYGLKMGKKYIPRVRLARILWEERHETEQRLVSYFQREQNSDQKGVGTNTISSRRLEQLRDSETFGYNLQYGEKQIEGGLR